MADWLFSGGHLHTANRHEHRSLALVWHRLGASLHGRHQAACCCGVRPTTLPNMCEAVASAWAQRNMDHTLRQMHGAMSDSGRLRVCGYVSKQGSYCETRPVSRAAAAAAAMLGVHPGACSTRAGQNEDALVGGNASSVAELDKTQCCLSCAARGGSLAWAWCHEALHGITAWCDGGACTLRPMWVPHRVAR